MRHRSYSELMHLDTIKERYEYLKLVGEVGSRTFGSNRFLNQTFYRSKQWKQARNEVIMRDQGCDLGISDYELYDRATIHHINPITIQDVIDENWDKLLNPENLITTSYNTHKAIHFGNERMLPKLPTERTPGDTCLWR